MKRSEVSTTLPRSLIGEHPSIVRLRQLIDRVGKSRARTVLIYGETGTGKGLVARLLHEASNRAAAPFVDINCAAIPGLLLESELFGHEKGAFTGAVGHKQGLIEAADGGTVFLDEVRELDTVMQAKLLTLLDTRRFRRVGAVRSTDVDVRFIAATNKILLGEVKAGAFRDDLYYRLQVVAINLPPLRERGEDIFMLAHAHLESCNRMHGSRMTEIDPEVEEVFRQYVWPGNVRELENLIERICLLEDGHRVRMEHLPDRIIREARQATRRSAPSVGSGKSYHAATADYQKQLIREALAATGNNIGEAAVRLELTRHALRHQMLKLELKLPGESSA
ncbi:MAG: sigma-54 dependent transcriptional regulator [Ottowia sp.]|uniref:sigma-54 interaction domain-containing protein n=1 Tax=Ottowia sp. TaxID=1898956 RepID=UPI003C7281E1